MSEFCKTIENCVGSNILRLHSLHTHTLTIDEFDKLNYDSRFVNNAMSSCIAKKISELVHFIFSIKSAYSQERRREKTLNRL